MPLGFGRSELKPLWDLWPDEPISKVLTELQDFNSIAMRSDGRWLATSRLASESPEICLWEFEDGSPSLSFRTRLEGDSGAHRKAGRELTPEENREYFLVETAR